MTRAADHRRDLSGHEYEPCLGGVQCVHCGTVNLRRVEVLPSGVTFNRWDIAFWASLAFFACSVVFAAFVYFVVYP